MSTAFIFSKRLKQQGDHNTEKPTKENSSNGSSVALKTPLQTAEYRRRRSAAAAASAPSDDFATAAVLQTQAKRSYFACELLTSILQTSVHVRTRPHKDL